MRDYVQRASSSRCDIRNLRAPLARVHSASYPRPLEAQSVHSRDWLSGPLAISRFASFAISATQVVLQTLPSVMSSILGLRYRGNLIRIPRSKGGPPVDAAPLHWVTEIRIRRDR